MKRFGCGRKVYEKVKGSDASGPFVYRHENLWEDARKYEARTLEGSGITTAATRFWRGDNFGRKEYEETGAAGGERRGEKEFHPGD